ncbi:hypothetical protein CDAR_612181 [Caerostris darwini]|uniref:Uncharacterized protein n=1 Tax=Caerostris darwini TaxID=1538125 RepID=A0AAV4S042_9ARAC|nr:hypothetical protein CDAR_612181 [Caerostris darwini]
MIYRNLTQETIILTIVNCFRGRGLGGGGGGRWGCVATHHKHSDAISSPWFWYVCLYDSNNGNLELGGWFHPAKHMRKVISPPWKCVGVKGEVMDEFLRRRTGEDGFNLN